MDATSPGDFQGFGLAVCVALFRLFVMFGLHVKLLLLRIIAWSVFDSLVNKVVNVDCPGIFLSMLVTCCPEGNDSWKTIAMTLLELDIDNVASVLPYSIRRELWVAHKHICVCWCEC